MSTWEHVLADGSTEEITLEGVIESGSLTHLDNAPEVIEGTITPPPMTTRHLGMYNGSWADFSGDPDGQAKTVFGHYPAVASSYYIATQQTLNVAKETTRVNRGISPLISLATNGTQRLTGIVSGNSADRTWLDQYLDALNAISLADPNVPVYATIDQEFEVRVTQGTITGGDASYSNYGAAMSYFFDRARTRCPNVKVGLWYGGSSGQRTNILTILQNIVRLDTGHPLNMHFNAFDPYAQSGTSPSTTWASRVNDVRTGTYATEYARLCGLAGFTIPLCVAETGINKASVSDATAAGWIGNLPDAIENSDLLWCVYFNRDSGGNGDWRIDGGTFQPRPLSVAAMGNALLTVNGR